MALTYHQVRDIMTKHCEPVAATKPADPPSDMSTEQYRFYRICQAYAIGLVDSADIYAGNPFLYYLRKQRM